MKPKTIQTQIDSDGVLRLEIPFSTEEAEMPVEVTIQPEVRRRRRWSPNFFTEVAGQWEGPFPHLEGRSPHPDLFQP